MNFLVWLMLGTGSFLSWAGLTGRSPALTAKNLLNGAPVPERNSWMNIDTAVSIVSAKWLLPGNQEPNVAQGTTNVTGSGYDPKAVKAAGGTRAAVVAFGMSKLGLPYEWGAAGPNKYDCSGLTMRAYQSVGISLPHNAAMQQLQGTRVSSPGIGDLAFWGPSSGHVAIYIGNGQLLHAPQAGDVVKISPVFDQGSINYRSYL